MKQTSLRGDLKPYMQKTQNVRTITANLKMSPVPDLPGKKTGHEQPAKRWLISSLILAVTTFGLHQVAHAGVFEALQERAANSGFLQSFLLIFVSEIGDKTFFIAGLLAARYSRLISFAGSIGALGVMTLISTLLGQLFNAVPPSLTQGVPFADYVAIAAFSYFGLKTLFDASQMKDNSGMDEEKEDAEKTVEEISKDERRKSILAQVFQTFTVVFAAEIGDRSFLSTIALSAANNPFAVATGAIAAHASATGIARSIYLKEFLLIIIHDLGIAVLGGALMSKYLSEKVIGYVGGTLFIIFAITTALGVF